MIKQYLPLITIFLCSVFLNADNGAGKGAGVYVVDVTRQPYSEKIEALGTLQANEQVALSASVTERVTALYFDDNQRVKKGDLLVELDARAEFAELAEEESRLAEASRQLKRLEPLAARGAASKSVLDESRLEVETAEARILAIRARIELRRIRAPFDGVLGLRNISVGSLVKNDSLITTIDDDAVMKLDFTVPSLHLPLLKKGLRIRAGSRAFGEREFIGVISAIDSRIDTISRAVTVRALIGNEMHILKPGLLMEVEMEVKARESIVLPEQCVISDGDQSRVLVIQQEGALTTVKYRKIIIGKRRKGYTEVLSGLREGEQVVSHGLMRAKPGKPVRIIGVQKRGDTLEDLLGSPEGEGRR